MTNERVDKVGNIAHNGDVFMVSTGNGWRPTMDEYTEAVDEMRAQADADTTLDPNFYEWSSSERTYVAIREQAYRIARHFEWRLEGGSLYD